MREGGVVLGEGGAEAGALEREGERAECAGEEGEDFGYGGRREEEGVEGVEDALRGGGGGVSVFGRQEMAAWGGRGVWYVHWRRGRPAG